MKVAINKCFGGFNLSGKAMKRYLELKGKPCYFYKQTKYAWRDGKNEYSKVGIPEKGESLDIVATKDFGESISKWPENDTIFYGDIKRTDPYLIQTIEELGDEARTIDIAKNDVLNDFKILRNNCIGCKNCDGFFGKGFICGYGRNLSYGYGIFEIGLIDKFRDEEIKINENDICDILYFLNLLQYSKSKDIILEEGE